MVSQVTIKRIKRNKRKFVTAIHGLEAFDIDLKKAAKFLAQKFATGASVTKNAQGQDEIVAQGDVSNEVVKLIKSNTGILKGIPQADVEIVKKIASRVTIKRIQPNKCKFGTAINGLEAYIDLKEATKTLAQMFATGACVTKNAQGQNEIVVQGDVAYEVLKLIESNKWISKGVPAANVETVKAKKKKAAKKPYHV